MRTKKVLGLIKWLLEVTLIFKYDKDRIEYNRNRNKEKRQVDWMAIDLNRPLRNDVLKKSILGKINLLNLRVR